MQLQLDKLELWGRVSSFTVTRRHSKVLRNTTTESDKTIQIIQVTESSYDSLNNYIDSVASPSSTLSFAQVRDLVCKIEWFLKNEVEPALRVFPNIEILPNISGLLLTSRGRRRSN